jgi:uncharacterized protein
LSPKREVVIAGPPEEFLRELRSRFLPRTVALLSDATFFPAAAQMHPLDGKTAAYVCENYSCQQPISQLADFVELLQ